MNEYIDIIYGEKNHGCLLLGCEMYVFVCLYAA